MIDFLKIEDAPDLVKDTSSGAVLNTNLKSLEAYRKQRDKAKKVEQLESRVMVLESTVQELKNLVRKLTEKSNGN
jgi:hypothetical protein